MVDKARCNVKLFDADDGIFAGNCALLKGHKKPHAVGLSELTSAAIIGDDIEFIKAIWKSAHSVHDFPGKVTIRRFSPFKKVVIIGEGRTEPEAWRNAVEREKVSLYGR